MSFSKYPAYKDSGVAWLGEVPESWVVGPLKASIARIESGTSVNAVDTPAEGDQFGVLKTSCVYTGQFDATENKAVVFAEYDRVACPVMADTLIVSRMNTPDLVGAAGLSKQKHANLFLPDRLWQVYPLDACVDYMHYWTRTSAYRAQVEMACAGTSSSMQNLGQDDFRAFMFPRPSTAEQAAIATFLDRETAKIDALVEEQKRLIELLKAKRQAVISQAVTKGLDPNVPMKDSGVAWLGKVPTHWEITRLKHATACIIDCPHETPTYSDDSEFKVIRTADLSDGRLDLSNAYALAEVEYQRRIRRGALLPGDIVYGREGERWGHAALVPQAPVCCLGQRMMQFRASKEFCSAFLMWSLNSQPVYRQGQLDTVGATSPHVNVETIRNYVLAQPPVSEQEAIARIITQACEQFDNLIAEAEARRVSS